MYHSLSLSAIGNLVASRGMHVLLAHVSFFTQSPAVSSGVPGGSLRKVDPVLGTDCALRGVLCVSEAAVPTDCLAKGAAITELGRGACDCCHEGVPGAVKLMASESRWAAMEAAFPDISNVAIGFCN